MGDPELELLSKFVSAIAETTYECLVQSQTALQLLAHHNIISFEEAKEMRNEVEKKYKLAVSYRSAIEMYDKKKAKQNDFELLFKKAISNRDSMTEEENARLANYLNWKDIP